MTTPTFIRFGEEGDMVFNTSEILWFQHEDVKITDENRHIALPSEAAAGKLFCVRVSIRNHTGLLLTCGTPENRAVLFNIMASKLQTTVLSNTALVSATSKEIASSDSDTATKQPNPPAPSKRPRKRGLQDEVIKPTDDLT